MHYMIITIAQNITLNTCTTVAINNQYTVPTESIFIYFKYCSYSKSKLLELTQPKYKKNIYTTNKKLPVYIYTRSIDRCIDKVCIGNLCHSINLITAYVHKKTSWYVLNRFITYYMKLSKTFKLTEPIWYEK